LTESKEIALWFDELCSKTTNYKAASNWVMGPIKSLLNEYALLIRDFPIKAETLADMIGLIDEGKVSYTAASQKIYPELLRSITETPLEIAKRLNLIQESDAESLRPIVEQVLKENQIKVGEYKAGKKGLIGLFMGEVMKKSQGKADPKVATILLTELLEN
jgi:aspartyl-tRNA(Asn)/glutamyl-tRNA(Gln) amidotransferase subunit B